MPQSAFRKLVVFLTALLAPALALAWGKEGHRIIATIAWEYLTPDARATVETLLKDDADKTLADTSTWADRIRSDHSYDWVKPLPQDDLLAEIEDRDERESHGGVRHEPAPRVQPQNLHREQQNGDPDSGTRRCSGCRRTSRLYQLRRLVASPLRPPWCTSPTKCVTSLSASRRFSSGALGSRRTAVNRSIAPTTHFPSEQSRFMSKLAAPSVTLT